MKTKSLFLGALTCLAFAACSDDDKVVNPNGSQAENGTAVIAVSFSMPTGNATKVADWNNENSNYTDGDTYETKVNTAMLYFYKGDALWQAVDVKSKITESWENGTDKTIQLNSNIFLALENVSENNYPDKVVAVLNGPEIVYNTFSELCANINVALNSAVRITTETGENSTTTETATGNFVMSNAVYYSNDGSTVMNYTPVSIDNFGTGKDISAAQQDAQNNPLKIIVERVLARVNVTGIINNNVKTTADANNENNTHPYATIDEDGQLTSTSEKKTILAELQGWWLDNTNSQSNLVKTLEPSYTFKYDGFDFTWENWNDETNQRSYWATAINSTAADNSKFQHYYYSQYNNQDKYCYENTNMSNPTRLVVAATLKIEGEAKDLVQYNTLMWDSLNFMKHVVYQLEQVYQDINVTHENLKLVWNTQTNGTENNITTRYSAEDRTILTGEETTRELKDYEAMVQVITSGTGAIASITYKNEGTDATLTADELNTKIEDILRGPVKYWNNGQTYFFTNIAQLKETKTETVKGEDDTETQVTTTHSLPGIIRNHLYKITINSVVGLGTPVPTDPKDPEDDPEYPEVPNPTPDPDPDPDQPIIPETPEDDEISAIDAQISILKYRVVNQSVDLQ